MTYRFAELLAAFPEIAASSYSDGEPRKTARVDKLRAAISEPGQWHNNVRDVIASLVAKGLTDDEILLFAPGLTTRGYTVEQTERELQEFASSARRKWGHKPSESDFSDFEAGSMGQNEVKPHRASGFPLIRVGDMTFSAPQFVVYGLLETSSLALAFGEPGCGKSFIAIDLACCIASGLAFHGREVKGGPVIYLAGEGHSGIKRRTIAWERHNGQSLQNSPLYFSRVPARLLDADHAKSVAKAVDNIATKEGNPVLIVIDTLARSFAGGDENSTKDMNDFVAAVDDMKARYPGCTVLIIHHSGHSDKQRPRGAGSLKGALDAEYMVKRQGEIVSVTSPKMKDAPDIEPLAFKLKSIDVGVTEDGEVFTSAVLEETQAQRQKGPVLTGNNKLAMETFLRAKANAGAANDPSVAVHLEDWRSEFYAAHTGDNQASKKTIFNRARGELVAKGFLSVLNDFYRLSAVSDGNS